eukprot:NODE_10761_length_493_cov_7.608108_g10109_i0.p1 GENE.NODE_10761_length_493_cov_7.608108_g10109_i0~~NODE_10761_length_493_cov_7.608108_g10109_i0.p1  ORF type:complete len:163 (+),score=20.99 NODE_10761_length_493_cov_7.608108_g10109_i0:51-491(+)
MSSNYSEKGQEGRRIEDKPKDLSNGLKFFGNRLCPYAHRSWWTAIEKGISMDYIHIDLGANYPSWYQEVNPSEEVPCLFDEGKRITESIIIDEYFEEKWSKQGTQLMPNDYVERAEVRRFINWFCSSGVMAPAHKLTRNQDPSTLR